MKLFNFALLLLGSAEAEQLNSGTHVHSGVHSRHRKSAVLDTEQKLSQSFASAFQMAPPKLMNSPDVDMPKEKGVFLSAKDTGNAFLDGWYMNTTRSENRKEMLGDEA